MTKQIIIGVDPGTTTGVAAYSVNQQKFIMTLELDDPVSAVRGIGGLISLFEENNFTIKLVSERVDLLPEELRGKTQDGIRDALRVANALWFIGMVYDGKIEHTEVLRASSKHFVSDAQLRRHDWYDGSRHIRDAMRVVITHLAQENNQDFLKVWAN